MILEHEIIFRILVTVVERLVLFSRVGNRASPRPSSYWTSPISEEKSAQPMTLLHRLSGKAPSVPYVEDPKAVPDMLFHMPSSQLSSVA